MGDSKNGWLWFSYGKKFAFYTSVCTFVSFNITWKAQCSLNSLQYLNLCDFPFPHLCSLDKQREPTYLDLFRLSQASAQVQDQPWIRTLNKNKSSRFLNLNLLIPSPSSSLVSLSNDLLPRWIFLNKKVSELSKLSELWVRTIHKLASNSLLTCS